jgi:hypothetical protein
MRIALIVAALSLSACSTTAKRPPSHALIRSSERYLDWDQLHGPFGVDPITEAQARGRWHYAFVREKGQVVEIIRVSPTGEPFARRKLSYEPDGSSRVDFYDAWGTLDMIMVVDANGYESVTHRSGVQGRNGCHHQRHIADAAGVIAETICYDAANQPIVNDDGCERVQFVRNARRHAIETACFRADGTKATFSSEFHRSRESVDALGYATSLVYLDVDGAPLAAGCAYEKREHAASGGTSRRSCKRRDGTFDWETRAEYDTRGCQTEIASVDGAGKPREFVDVAFVRMKTDEHCAILRRETLDGRGRPSGTVAIRTYVRDAMGRTTIERCFDSLQHPVSCIAVHPQSHGVEVRFDYDERGRVSRRRCYASDGKPDLCADREEHETRFDFAADGHVFSTAYFDAAGQPMLVHGIARTTYTRDAFGSVVAERNFGVDGAAITPAGGCYEVLWRYDEHHRLSSIECRDTLGFARTNALCLVDSPSRKTCFAKGASLIRVVRNGGKVENVHLGPTGNEIMRVDCEQGACLQ